MKNVESRILTLAESQKVLLVQINFPEKDVKNLNIYEGHSCLA